MRSEVALKMDLMREEIQLAVEEARQFTVEHYKELQHDLSEELVAVKQECEGRTEVVKTKVEEVKEMTRLRHSLEKQSVNWREAPVLRKLADQKFDGQVAWEAYQAQFELLAQEQGWRAQDKAL
ncbi:hypothetical protein E2C01_057042 [Portunus trituberculatus]|uniref:Uncharacterized protein n=1 Tax=Portunus trituberculatus TaxID=210409 RepID=A0A5B7GRZ0_PORTR|nr:hypothetical protein [Portunus trituberculatus]